ncbi:LysR family transcriptional regulator [Variovorax sp. ZS18.2.2]|uniref:LysR family transcriptional regulator n=1 Tax=Variovorax sp. ZS18.2.2 TaxID=2971255 RepID=UPI0021509589|nr:LysR family transcriptional regulator [Variovorax sp. ZS18.2.2]MCR6480973.1 LysR family transcriptional regulator [Variovorax sp. ZS18.2.2]
MSKLDLEWLALFDEIYKSGKVSSAAKIRGLTQSSASSMLNKLREHFRDDLFTRTPLGMQPTPFAELIAPNLRQAVELLASAETLGAGFDPAKAERTFRLSMTDISEIVLLPRLLAHLHVVAPLISVMTEVISEQSSINLANGGLDFAVGFAPQFQAGFYQQTLFVQDIVCLAARDHPRIGDSLTREQYEAEGHAVVMTPNTGHGIIEKSVRDLGLTRKIKVRPSTFLSLGHIVAKTDLLSLVPRLLGETLTEQAPLKMLTAPFPLPTYEVKQYWHSRFHAEPGSQWFRQSMHLLFGSSAR